MQNDWELLCADGRVAPAIFRGIEKSKLLVRGVLAQYQIKPPPARWWRSRAALALVARRNERNLLAAFFFLGATIGGCEAIDGVQPSKPIVAESLAIRFSFLCLYWQKEKVE